MRTARIILPIIAISCLALVACKKKPKDSKKKAPATAMTADGMDMGADNMGADDMAAPPSSDGFPKLDCNKSKESRRKAIKRDKKGRVIYCYLNKPQVIDGVKCRSGGYYVSLYETGRLKECDLGKGSTVKKKGIKCGTGAIKLYPGGAVEECVFTEKVRTLNGVKCKWRAEFHKNGRLKRCDTGAAYTQGKLTIGNDSWIYFKEDGYLYRADMAKNPYSWKGHKCKYAYFYRNGGVKTCQISKKIKIDGKETPLNVTLCFNKKGKPTKKVEGGFSCGNLKKAIKLLKKLKK